MKPKSSLIIAALITLPVFIGLLMINALLGVTFGCISFGLIFYAQDKLNDMEEQSSGELAK